MVLGGSDIMRIFSRSGAGIWMGGAITIRKTALMLIMTSRSIVAFAVTIHCF